LDIANLILLVALVCITAYYAKKTAEMAVEMQRARKDALRPVTMIHSKGHVIAGVETISTWLANIGPGPALDVLISRKVGSVPYWRLP
jgi:hypothetical protein